MTTEVTRLQACIEPELPARRLQGDGDGDGMEEPGFCFGEGFSSNDSFFFQSWWSWSNGFVLVHNNALDSPPQKSASLPQLFSWPVFFWSPLRRARMRRRWWTGPTLRLFQQRSCVMSTQRSALDVSNWACMDIPGDRTGSKMWQQQGRTMYFTAGGFAFKAEAGTSTKSWAVKARQLRICKVGMTFQFFPIRRHLTCVLYMGLTPSKGWMGRSRCGGHRWECWGHWFPTGPGDFVPPAPVRFFFQKWFGKRRWVYRRFQPVVWKNQMNNFPSFLWFQEDLWESVALWAVATPFGSWKRNLPPLSQVIKYPQTWATRKSAPVQMLHFQKFHIFPSAFLDQEDSTPLVYYFPKHYLFGNHLNCTLAQDLYWNFPLLGQFGGHGPRAEIAKAMKTLKVCSAPLKKPSQNEKRSPNAFKIPFSDFWICLIIFLWPLLFWRKYVWFVFWVEFVILQTYCSIELHPISGRNKSGFCQPNKESFHWGYQQYLPLRWVRRYHFE